MPEYTVFAVTSVVVVLLLERFVFRSGLFRTWAFWIAYAIIAFFQCVIDGFLTRRPNPVVGYNEDEMLFRFPFSIPVEDWFFGFSLVTLALLFWKRFGPAE